MADFLLVHGACHGAWCWRDLIPALKAEGHSARAIDMPSHGDDPTPASEVTLANCGQSVLDACTPGTIVVGHSWGGYPISWAAEANPNLMRALVYLCAYVPENGVSMADMRRRAKRQPVMGALTFSDDRVTASFDPKAAAGLFYSDCAQDVMDYALARLCPQPVLPQNQPIDVGPAWESVPKFYIRCLHDETIPPEYQAEMVQDWPRDRVFEMPTSHSPFFSDPNGLAALLTRIAGRF